MEILKLREEFLKNFPSQNNGNSFDYSEYEQSKTNKNNQLSNDSVQKNITDLFEMISEKINNIEQIDGVLIENIYLELKNISDAHNKKINEWFDIKYSTDLDILKNNFACYNKLNNEYLTNSFVIIEKNNDFNNAT